MLSPLHVVESVAVIPKSILDEITDLASNGYKEITLLGQNVDSYLWYGGGLKKDFNKATALQQKTAIRFENLLSLVAEAPAQNQNSLFNF